jgi:iron(III) transport system permease protein
MTLAAACGWSLVRSLAVALAAGPVCSRQSAWLKGMVGRTRRLAWFVLVIPFLCPELWTGYAWSGFALRVAGTDFWNLFPAGLFPSPPSIIARDAAVDEFLLDLLLFFRAVPVGTLVVYFAPPPPLSAEAHYCRALALGKSSCRMGFQARPSMFARAWKPMLPKRGVPFGWLGFALRSRWHAALPAIGLMFLVSFQEFELASLIGRPAWTVWLFDAQVGGLALHESLRLVILPVTCQIAVLAPAAWWILRSRSLSAARSSPSRPKASHWQFGAWVLPIVAAALVVVVPAMLVGKGSLEGLVRIMQSAAQLKTLLKEIVVGTGYALAAALAAMLMATPLLQTARESRLARAGILAGGLPGLFGALVLSLALIRLLQQPYLQVLYRTPAALALGLTLFLLPRAIALRLLLSSSERREGVHLAALLGASPARAARGASRELNWQLQWRSEFWSMALLTCWGFLELTIAYLLAPVTIVSAPVMLYNQMHFGKNAILAARVLITVVVPALLFVLASASRRYFFRWFWR